MFHSRIQQSIYALLRTKVTFRKSEKLNIEYVFRSKIILDALTELSSLEIILLIQDNTLKCIIFLPGNELGLYFSLEN